MEEIKDSGVEEKVSDRGKKRGRKREGDGPSQGIEQIEGEERDGTG